MAYNSIISRSDAAALIPEEASREILKNLPEQSAVMRMARRLPNISRAQLRIPVMSALATAYFVTGDTGLKQTSEVNWSNKYLDAEEIAAIVPIPESVLDDADYDIWGEVRPSIEAALAKAFDAAVLVGTNIPATWTTDLGAAGLKAVCTAASHTLSLASYADEYEALLGETPGGTDGVLMSIEADGFMVTGSIAHVSMRGKLRNARDSEGHPIFLPDPMERGTYMLDGAPIAFPLNGAFAASDFLMIAGDWTKLVYAMRQDITYKVLDQAVITDASGAIIYNLAQQDMVALRAVMRVGVALPAVINQLGATNASAFACLTA